MIDQNIFFLSKVKLVQSVLSDIALHLLALKWPSMAVNFGKVGCTPTPYS